jgi:outer membrane murein-binding lipoprotein Lpp
MNKIISIIFIFIVLAGCSSAQKASEVNAVRVSVAPYLQMDCKALATEQNSLLTEARSLGAQVDSEYNEDKGAELVAWILFAPAAFFIDGNPESAGQLASIKGQLEAVQEAQKINDCVR